MEKKFCKNCGGELRDGDDFCVKCGARAYRQSKNRENKVVEGDECGMGGGESDERLLFRCIAKNVRLSRALLGAYIVFFISVLAIIALAFFRLSGEYCLPASPHWALVISSVCTVVAAVLGGVIPIGENKLNALLAKIPKTPHGHRIGFIKWFFSWIILVVCFVSWFTVVLPCGISVRGYLVALGYLVAVGLLFVLCEYVAAKRKKALSEYLRRHEALERDAPLKAAGDNGYETKINKRKFIYGAADDSVLLMRLRRFGGLVGWAAAMFAVFTAIAAVVSCVITYKFGSWYANIFAVRAWGDNKISGKDLVFLYGRYNFIREAGDAIVVEYYGDDYLDLYEGYYKLSEKLADGDSSSMSRIVELQKQMANGSFDYLAFQINLTHDDSYQDGERHDTSQYRYDYLSKKSAPDFSGELVGIMLDKKHGGTGVKKKEKGKISCKPSIGDKKIYDIEIYYSDGSYIWRSMRITQPENAEIILFDEWGNSYIVNIGG